MKSFLFPLPNFKGSRMYLERVPFSLKEGKQVPLRTTYYTYPKNFDSFSETGVIFQFRKGKFFKAVSLKDYNDNDYPLYHDYLLMPFYEMSNRKEQLSFYLKEIKNPNLLDEDCELLLNCFLADRPKKEITEIGMILFEIERISSLMLKNKEYRWYLPHLLKELMKRKDHLEAYDRSFQIKTKVIINQLEDFVKTFA